MAGIRDIIEAGKQSKAATTSPEAMRGTMVTKAAERVKGARSKAKRSSIANTVRAAKPATPPKMGAIGAMAAAGKANTGGNSTAAREARRAQVGGNTIGAQVSEAAKMMKVKRTRKKRTM